MGIQPQDSQQPDLKQRLREKVFALKTAQKEDINAKIETLKGEVVSLKEQISRLLAKNKHRFIYEFNNDPLVPDAAKTKMENLEKKLKDSEVTLGLCIKDRSKVKRTLQSAKIFLRNDKDKDKPSENTA